MAEFPALSTLKHLASGAFSAKLQGTTLGRFELRRILGQGAQSVVWLGFDPRLEREVAIKIMRAETGATANASAVAQWLQEARSVSRLTHPNIVPVFEADVHDRQPYLVFEYVPGQTLEALLRTRGALAPQEAVPLMLDVLEALAAAHAAGVVHRDMKPSNVLVDEAGRARVMDFGIAARVQQTQTNGVPVPGSGTPGYLSPEAASGAAPSPAMDVFSAGLVLAELLTGVPLVFEKDPYRAIYRAVHEQLALPDDVRQEVDDSLRAVVMRSLARDPALRYPGAQAFRDDLVRWATPAAIGPTVGGDVPGGTAGNSTLDFLLRRMRFTSDFPALSDSVVRIQSIVNSDRESVGSLTNEILKDVALTNKLLRLINSAHFAQGGSISTVSRAVSLVGFNGIRNMALSLVLLEQMQDKAHASLLKEEFLRSLMAGSIAGELCPLQRDSEEAFIGSMFQNLGRLLAEFYFPEDAREIRGLMASARQPLAEAAASAKVLGLNFEGLGIGVARAWGLPEGIQRCMRRPAGDPPGRPPEDALERVRWIAVAANDIADTLLRADPKDADAQLALVARRYARALGADARMVHNATIKARQKLIELASAMELKVLPGSRAAKLLVAPVEDPAGRKETQDADADHLDAHELQATPTVVSLPQDVLAQDVRRITDVLAAGIQDITNAMVDDFKLADVLRMVLETMFRAMDFQRIIFCMRDARTETLTGRFGLGQEVEKFVPLFKVPLKPPGADLFSAVCLKGADTMISDATEPRLAQRLPAWYRQTLNAPTFLLLPLQMKSAPFGLIYADKSAPGGLALDDKELALLRTLRNQAIMAFRQSG